MSETNSFDLKNKKKLTDAFFPGQWMVHEMSVRRGGRSAGFPDDPPDIGCPPFHGDEDDCCCCWGNSAADPATAEDLLCCPFCCFVFDIGVMVMLGELVRWAGRPAGTDLAAGAEAGEDCAVKGRFLDAIAAAAPAPLRRGLGCAPCCFGCCCCRC